MEKLDTQLFTVHKFDQYGSSTEKLTLVSATNKVLGGNGHPVNCLSYSHNSKWNDYVIYKFRSNIVRNSWELKSISCSCKSLWWANNK